MGTHFKNFYPPGFMCLGWVKKSFLGKQLEGSDSRVSDSLVTHGPEIGAPDVVLIHCIQ